MSEYITEEEASKLTGLSRHYIYELAQQEKIRAYQPEEGPERGTWRVHKRDLLAYKQDLEQPRDRYDPRDSAAEEDDNGEH